MSQTKKLLDDYWLKYYATQFCTICGNSGVIDSRGVRTPAGVLVGRRNWCICPNGQAMLNQYNGVPAEIVLKHFKKEIGNE